MTYPNISRVGSVFCLNPRSCAASSMTAKDFHDLRMFQVSQSAFVRGFIDDFGAKFAQLGVSLSQSAFVRGFIDDEDLEGLRKDFFGSQSAFVRGFIDDEYEKISFEVKRIGLNPRSCAASSMTRNVAKFSPTSGRLNPRSCAASSMTLVVRGTGAGAAASQSAFVRGFIDDTMASIRSYAAEKSQSAFVRGFIDDR